MMEIVESIIQHVFSQKELEYVLVYY